MGKMRVAIYDTDRLYRERFADYLMNYKSEEMELAVFSGISFLTEALAVDKYQLIVLGGGYEEALPKLRSVRIPVLVLTESTGVLVRESVGMQEKNVSFTSRYQSMDAITRRMHILADVERSVVVDTKNVEVIGVYSPMHHEMQMLFSVLYAKNLAQSKKVLYLNFMDFSGFYEIFGEKEYDLTDLILEIRGESSKERVNSAYIYEQERFSYICPPKNPEDLKLISGEGLKEVITYAVEKLGYEAIVVDIGSVVETFSVLLESFTMLYCIGKNSGIHALRQREFMAYLERIMGEAYLEKVKELELPCIRNVTACGKSLLDQLNWSEFGDYVRAQTGGSTLVDR